MSTSPGLWFCLLLALVSYPVTTRAGDAPPLELHLGYTQMRTNLPGGRQANIVTMRAMSVAADGSGRQAVAEELARQADSWTQFAGWSPDGNAAVVVRGWESPENARWEEVHRTFRFTPESWSLDVFLCDQRTGESVNLTAVERVSFYNSGLFFWPGNDQQLGFTALIDGNSHPYRMDRDGRNKRDLTKDSREFAYGFNASPDGRRIAYHKSYRIYLANADGSDAVEVKTGQPFNFAPQWSPDGSQLLFVSGEHYNCHPHVVAADGTGLRKIADRGGYRGVIEFLDVPDYHGGSSDLPVWSADGKTVFFTARQGESVELFRTSLDGKREQLTTTPAGSLHYHPTVSPDGKYLVYGSKRDGVRQLYVRRIGEPAEFRITDLSAGQAAMWPYWRPTARRE